MSYNSLVLQTSSSMQDIPYIPQFYSTVLGNQKATVSPSINLLLINTFNTSKSLLLNSNKHLIRAKEQLRIIQDLPDDWNENGAKSFSKKLIRKAFRLLSGLKYIPFVCPTANESIQFEYDKDNGEYLEFEIFENHIELYQIDKNMNEHEEIITHDAEAYIRKKVKEFYAES